MAKKKEDSKKANGTAATETPRITKQTYVQELAHRHGEMLFDLFDTILGDSETALHTYRAVLKELRLFTPKQRYLTYERPWVIKTSIEHLKGSADAIHSRWEEIHSLIDQDSQLAPDERIKKFNHYLGRLDLIDQTILLLLHKYDVPIEDVATALGTTPSSLELRSEQALRTLDDWIWESSRSNRDKERIERLIQAIAALPKKELTPSIKNDPLSSEDLPESFDRSEGQKKSRWQRTPWFVRTSVESAGITLIILLIVAMVPRIREVYLKNLEHKLNSYVLPEVSPETDDSTESSPLDSGEGTLDASREGGSSVASEDTLLEVDTDITDAEQRRLEEDEEIYVGNSEIWRFNLKTYTLRETSRKVVKILGSLDLEKTDDNLKGVKVPGGVQFDILVPKDSISSLKKDIELIARDISREGSRSAEVSEIFKWYRQKSRRRITAGKSRAVIWVSQY